MVTLLPPDRNHSEQPLSPAMEDYLKSIYRLGEKMPRVTTQSVADRLQVAPASVTSMVKKLAARGLLTHERYYGVELTPAGRQVAREMIRHHRLLELYLQRALGFEEDQVHAEAERLDHFISEQLEERIDEMLGRPTTDPHGSPIPERPDKGPCGLCFSLAELELFAPARVTESADETLEINDQVLVLGRPHGASLHVKVNGQERLMSPEQARLTRVERS